MNEPNRNVFNYINKILTGAENNGPFNVPVRPTDNNALNWAAYRHDTDPRFEYLRYNQADEDYVNDPGTAGTLGNAIFRFKKKTFPTRRESNMDRRPFNNDIPGWKRHQSSYSGYNRARNNLSNRRVAIDPPPAGRQRVDENQVRRNMHRVITELRWNASSARRPVRGYDPYYGPRTRVQTLFRGLEDNGIQSPATGMNRNIGRASKSKMAGRRKYNKKFYKRTGRKMNSAAILKALTPACYIHGRGSYLVLHTESPGLVQYWCREYGAGTDAASTLGLIHGSSKRWSNVFQAALNVTADTTFDNAKNNYWEQSATFNTVVNTSNYDMTIDWYEIMLRKGAPQANAHFGPLYQWNEDATNMDSDAFPANSADAYSSILTRASYTEPDDSAGKFFAQYQCEDYMDPMSNHLHWSKIYKVIKHRHVKLAPGDKNTFVQKSFYGKILGSDWDDEYAVRNKTRWVVIRKKGPISYFSTVGAQVGNVSTINADPVWITRTFDKVRLLPVQSGPKFVQIDNQVAGANQGAYTPYNSVATVAQVPSGLANVAFEQN